MHPSIFSISCLFICLFSVACEDSKLNWTEHNSVSVKFHIPFVSIFGKFHWKFLLMVVFVFLTDFWVFNSAMILNFASELQPFSEN